MPVINYETRRSASNYLPSINTLTKYLKQETFWFFSLVAGFVKTLIFLGLITTNSTSWTSYLLPMYNSSWVIYLAFMASLFSIQFLFKGRNRLRALIATNALVTALIIMDLMYYRGFGNFVSLHLLKQTSNVENLGGAIFSMLRPYDAVFLLDIIAMVFVLNFNKSIGQDLSRNIILFILFTILPIGYLSFSHYKYDILEKGENRHLFEICWTSNETMSNLSPIGYHVYDTYLYLKENQPRELSNEDQQKINNWFSQNKETLPDNEFKGLFKGQNLILLQVESLENFVLNQSVNNQEITPVLNQLVNNSIYFSNIHEQVWNGTTSDAELLANTSIFPVRRGSTFFRFPENRYNSLPVLLKSQGYYTQAIHPDKGSYWNWRQALTSFGFDNTIDASAFDQTEQIGLGLSDGSFLRQVVPILKETPQPFYNFMITLTSHGPFDLPKEYRELKLEEELDKTKMGGYFQSIHYTDQQIGQFLEELDKAKLLDNTVVVIYGDHGGVHKYYQDEVSKITPSEDWWSKPEVKLPLLVYKKGMEGKRVDTLGGQIDILPTVAYLMGIEKEKYHETAMGRNLLNTKRAFSILGDGTFIGSDEKEKAHAIQGIDIADTIIQTRYFEEHLKLFNSTIAGPISK